MDDGLTGDADKLDAPASPLRTLDREALLARLTTYTTYEGGYNGSCYQCPFASEPCDDWGHVHDWSEVANDPTEAHFRSLPGRDGKIEWGEYAPCTAEEWRAGVEAATSGDAGAHDVPGTGQAEMPRRDKESSDG